MYEFWSVFCVVVGLPLLFWFAKVVDSRSDWDKDLKNADEEEISALLGVVMPKNEEKEEK